MKQVYYFTFFMISLLILRCEMFAQSNIQEPAKLYFDEVVNKKRIEILPEIFSTDYVFHEMNGEESRHMKNNTLVPHLKYIFKAFPDLIYTVERTIAENDKVALYTTATGPHKDEFLGFQPTGKKIMYKHMFLFRISNGKIVEGWGVVDVFGLQEQLKGK